MIPPDVVAPLVMLLGAGAIAWIVVPPVRSALRQRRWAQTLPDLTAMERQPDVWRLSPPTGQGWQLWSPQTPRDQHNFLIGEPVGSRPPLTSEYDEPEPDLDEIAVWARPWIEQASGGRVVDLAEGWVSYGPGDELAEYAVLALVQR